MSEPATPAAAPLFPPLVLAIFIACVAGAASLANCALIAAIIRRAKNGLFCFIIQLSIADFMLLSVSIGPELWSRNTQTWDFGRSSCVAFRGISIFASTASIYLVATIALHTLATINLEDKLAAQKVKRNSTEEDEEMRSSRHSLVASSDTSTPPRTMNLDYRLVDTRVPIAPPTFFVWFLCASLSIPEFTLATTIRLDHGIVCSLVDSSHKLNMHFMLALFNFFLPVLIMTTISFLISFKLISKKRNNFNELVPALKLSLCLIVVYFVMCAPRTLLNLYGIYSTATMDSAKEHTIINEDWLRFINLICSSLHLLSTLVRPLLCISLLPRIRKKFSFGFGKGDAEHV
ncbi:unnamed protein product [Colias eurytheme]|nr:unnamed protein product [Colias eurytheme]